MHEHWFHFLPVILLVIGFCAYYFKDSYRFNPLIFLSLVLFISSHVMPLGMLAGHHDSAEPDAQHHISKHACCLPAVTPTLELACATTCLPSIEISSESTTVVLNSIVLSDNNKSPPATS